MWTHLQLVNLCIGLQKGFDKLPTPFGAHGYDLAAVGTGFTLSDGTTIKPDVLLHAAQRGYSLLVEAKQGASVDLDQLTRYRRCAPTDLRDRAFCHVPSLGTHAVQTLYVVNEEHASAIEGALGRAGVTVPMICVSSSGYRLAGSGMQDAALNAELGRGAQVRDADFPYSFFLPIDEQTKPQEAVDAVLTEVVAMLDRGVVRFKPEDVVKGLIRNINPEAVHGVGGGSPVSAMNSVVRAILKDVAAGELMGWIESAGANDLFTAKRSVSRVDRKARVREIRSLKASVGRAINRVRTELPLFDQ